MSRDAPVVLFVCTQNAGRSQMAEALFRRAAGEKASARSAGTKPAAVVHPEVVDVMAEIGIDLADHTPKALSHDVTEGADIVVTMGCGDECPVIPGARVIDWDLPDPAGKALNEVREIRDEIARRVNELLADLS
jgi:arsenate reductase